MKKLVVVSMLCTMLALTGCTVSVNGEEVYNSKNKKEVEEVATEKVEEKKEPEESSIAVLEVKPEEKESEVEGADTPTTLPMPVGGDPIMTVEEAESRAHQSTDVKAMHQLAIDGVVFTLPIAPSDLEAAGWTYDWSNVEFDDGSSILNPGEIMITGIDLENDKYGHDFNSADLRIRQGNATDAPVELKDALIYEITATRVYGYTMMDKYPDLALYGGITWGSTADELRAVFGTEDYLYESEQYNVYTWYSVDGITDYRCTVYHDKGLCEVELDIS